MLFASLVDDPASHPEQFPTEADQERERQRLFGIIEELVKWENSTNERVLEQAREEIRRSCGGNPPPVLDPFCGGGSIPLEAQRLGLEAHASDLNPVAVLITKALIEIPPKFAGREPVNPDWQKKAAAAKAMTTWTGAAGLAEDVRWYGKQIQRKAQHRIGYLYPSITITRDSEGDREDLTELIDRTLTPIAWIWARTITCSNPACAALTPITKTFQLCSKAGNEAHVVCDIDRRKKTTRFRVLPGCAQEPNGNVTRQGVRCLICNSDIPLSHIRAQAQAGQMGQVLMAIVAEGPRRRVYLHPNREAHESALIEAARLAAFTPSTDLPEQALGFRVQKYGMTTHASLFSRRQLVALSTFSDLIKEAFADVATASAGDESYAIAVTTYLAFALDKAANYWSSLCSWYASKEIMVSTFGLPTLSMVWDFAEANPFSESSGNWGLGVEQAASALRTLLPGSRPGLVSQQDAVQLVADAGKGLVIATDPPYYDNIGYAALSDFFYVWLRHTLSACYPDLFLTTLTPKQEELVADPGRFGNNKALAVAHFEQGLSGAFARMREASLQGWPISLFYAFKQQDRDRTDDDAANGAASTGWEKMLSALLEANFLVCGTWPVRTEQSGGLREAGRNALASSIVLVCRVRPSDARPTTRRDFLAALKRELPDALKKLQHGNIAPVDLAQAAIGPGMAVFSRYTQVLEQGGNPMTVRTALQLINQTLDEILTEQEGDYDPHTRWALTWYEQHGLEEGPFGQADVLARAKDCSLNGLVEAGVLSSRSGKVRLLRRDELPSPWSPGPNRRPYIWAVMQHLIRALETSGEAGAAAILREVGSLGDTARELAYRLYNTCERKKWAEEARAYNSLVIAWPHIQQQIAGLPSSTGQQRSLYDSVDE